MTPTLQLLLFLLIVSHFCLAIPNYLPPDDILPTLSPEWYRGLPNSSELDAISRHLSRREHHQRTFSSRASASLLSSCLLSSGLEIVTSILNTTETFWDAAQSDNLHFHWHPSAIVYPRTPVQVSQAVKCAAENGNVAVTARSGGHSFAGQGSGGQDGSLIVDLAQLDHVTLAPNGESVDIGPATRLGDVVKGLWKQQKAIPHGTCPPVGTGGHALCGGFGPTSRKWGMTTDVITQAQVVLANGSIVTVNPQDELLWGLKGAGHNFGIVTNFKFKTFDASGPHVFFEYRWSKSIKGGDQMADIATAAQAFASDNLPAEVGFHLQIQPAGSQDPPGGKLSMHMRGMYMGTLDKYQRHIIPRLWQQKGIPQPDAKREEEMSFLRLMEEWDDFGRPGDKLDTVAERIHRNNFIARTAIAMSQKGFTRPTLQAAFQHLFTSYEDLTKNKASRMWTWNLYLEMYGGSNARHRQDDIVRASSFPQRDGMWLIQSSVGTWGSHSFDSKPLEWIDDLDRTWVDAIQKDGMERKAFTCYADSHLSEEQWKQLYFGTSDGDTLKRLLRLKDQLDPYNLFRNGQSLGGMKSKAPSVKATGQSLYPENVHPLP